MAKNKPDAEIAYFRPRARLVSILGEHLIRDSTVGLIELVKNSYDADASQVRVGLFGLATPETTRIIVRDDGIGMTREIILREWLEPASGHKEQQKRAEVRTPKGRLPLGEKGVGRFAVHKLGRQFRLVSRAEGSATELLVEISWGEFEKHDAYLDKIPVRVSERNPTDFQGSATGTLLEMTGAREPWRESDLEKLSRSLRRLMSPIKGARDFRVLLECPDFPLYENLEPSELLQKAHCELFGIVDDIGVLEFEYKFKLPDQEPKTYSDTESLREGIKSWGAAEREPMCGPFAIYLYAWDRSPQWLLPSQVDQKDLDAHCGVSVYRDGVRILPYGEPGDDWLKLDQRRINIPAERLGNRNLIGLVEINQTENLELRDKTNREGLIENLAYRDFERLVFRTVQVLENHWSEDRPEHRKKRKTEPRIVPALEDLSRSVASVTALVQPLDVVLRDLERRKERGEDLPPETADALIRITGAKESLTELDKSYTELRDAYRETAQDFDSQRDVLLAMAGLGLAAERFTHEFARLTREASDALGRLQKRLPILAPDCQADLSALRAALDALRTDIVALGPLFYIRKAPREKTVDIEQVVKNAVLLNRSQLKDAGIIHEVKVVQPLAITMREGQCTQVFNNLIDNAVYWLGRKSDRGDRRLKILIDGGRKAVLVTDNGPGIHPRYRHRIFEPFFTTKTDGRGLGLYISQEIMAEKKGLIRLVDSSDEPEAFTQGAAFLVQFPDETASDEHASAQTNSVH